MKLSDLVTPERVILPLEAPTLAAAAWALLERLAATGAVTDAEKLQGRITEARGEDIVALGDRAFLTHYRTDAVGDLTVAIGVSPRPIAREAGETEVQQARIVLLILAPPRLAARYLQVLGAFARLLSRPETVDALLAAPTAEALAALPVLAAVEVPPQLTVREIMTERPRTTRPDTPLRDAAREMVRARIAALPVVGADGLLVGVAGFYPLVGEKMAHRGHVWGVYVDVAHRRQGIAGRLMENVLAHARTTVLQVHLAVVDGNQEALGLYRRLGFVSYGIEPRSLRVGGQFYDEHLMVWRADL